jgi:nucleoside phosphorylase
MSGICAGFSKEANLGQVVIASPAWEYQAGKWSKNGFEIAPVQIPLRPATRSVIDQAIARESFTQYLEAGVDTHQTRPRRQFKPILAPFATGSAVIADARRLEHVEKQHRKLAALDMETFGLYFVAHEETSVIQHFFSAKCVVDLADAEKDDDLHSYGCVVSARATEQLIRALLNPN